MDVYVPPGWPQEVSPPGSEDFEEVAAAWLAGLLPSGFRQYEVLRRFPVALASVAGHHVDGCVEGARGAYRACRRELAEVVPPHAADQVLAACRREGFRLVAVSRQVRLVGAALRGEALS